MMTKNVLKTCSKGHEFYKSSDCPVCPVCENERKPDADFMANLAAPARRALENANIHSLEALSQYTEKDVLKLHGMGKSSIPKLRELLIQHELTFKNESGN